MESCPCWNIRIAKALIRRADCCEESPIWKNPTSDIFAECGFAWLWMVIMMERWEVKNAHRQRRYAGTDQKNDRVPQLFFQNCRSVYAVSYTHLDVYKRQEPMRLPEIITMRPVCTTIISPSRGRMQKSTMNWVCAKWQKRSIRMLWRHFRRENSCLLYTYRCV